MIEVNSEEYWNRRFRGDWDNNDGDKQSLFFANQAIEMFPGWLRGILENGGKTFCDWGCAEGDGTDLLAKTYTKTYFEGIDFADNAIITAKNRFNNINNLYFHSIDLLTSVYDKKFDIVFSSNVFEHFADPFKVFDVISGYAKEIFVMVVPFNEDPNNLIDEHLHSFTSKDFNFQNEDWTIVHFSVNDVSQIRDSQWNGSQAMIIYVKKSLVHLFDLTFDNIQLTADLEMSNVLNLRNSIKDYIKLESSLKLIVQEYEHDKRELLNKLDIIQSEKDSLKEDLSEKADEVNLLSEDLRVRNDILTVQKNHIDHLVRTLDTPQYKMVSRALNIKKRIKPLSLLSGKIARINKRHKAKKIANKVRKIIDETGLFDPEFYLRNNIDVKNSGMDPTLHYLWHGHAERRRPSWAFDTQYYLERYPDVAVSGMDPMLHYHYWGKKEKRRPYQDDMSEYGSDYREYNQRWSNQRDYLANSVKAVKKSEIHKIASIIGKYVENGQTVLIMPLSYPLGMTQRPDHLMRYFSGSNIPCVIFDYSPNDELYIKEHKPGIYITNMFGAAISYLKDKNTVLYITYPHYSYLVQLINPTRIIYDVLDDLVTFSGNQRALREEHDKLLGVADIVLYSSKSLEKQNQSKVSGRQMLIENGVWASDFEVDSNKRKNIRTLKMHNEEKVVGYYGVVGNLLDWGLLKDVSHIKNLRLVFIGPKENFVNSESEQAGLLRDEVLRSGSVTHIETVPYEDLPYYSKQFDAAIIPFKLNDITHSVSPLKLFEYMAMGLKIFATPTRTLMEYDKYIEIDKSKQLVERIRVWSESRLLEKNIDKYRKVINRVDWASQLSAVYELINKNDEVKPFRGKYVDIINVNFYDWQGKVLYKGGAERYIVDLAIQLKKMGHHPRLLQNATKFFEKDYKGIPVVGVKTGEVLMRGMSRVYDQICSRSDLVIASPLDLACEIRSAKVIGINHGIHWDSKLNSLKDASLMKYSEVFDALKNIDMGVCVDTNFINWTRTYDYSFADKLKYIPNYYDAASFKADKKVISDKIVFMYPRRLYEARGIYITIDAFNILLKKYENIELLLVGQTDDDMVKKAVNKIIKRYQGRVKLEEYDMEDMHKAYKKSHVVLIPTLYSEGTSLSCLEAMATNNALISTNVGGLPNLVINGFNGVLISPTSEDLINAVESIMRDTSLIRRMSKNGLELVKVFEKNNWDLEWMKQLNEELGK